MSKSFSLFSFLIIGLLLTNSCKKDDEEVNPLPGTWVVSTEESTNCTDPDNDGTYTCTSDCLEYIFTETTITIGVDTYSYTLSGALMEIKINDSSVSVTFTIDGTTMTLINRTFEGCRVVTTLEKK